MTPNNVVCINVYIKEQIAKAVNKTEKTINDYISQMSKSGIIIRKGWSI